MEEDTPAWLTDSRSAWNISVRSWLTDIGCEQSLGEVKSMTTIKERPWSSVYRVTFEKGQSYFKACGAGGKHEPMLLLFLESLGFPYLPIVQAVEAEQGWILMADSGTPFREISRGVDQLQVLAGMLPRYAEMQMATMQSVEPLLALGLPNRQVNYLPRLLETLLCCKEFDLYCDAESVKSLRTLAIERLPALEVICGELSKSEYSASLDHGDLHLGNFLVKNNEHYLIDWGDASITHPFCSVMTTLETALDKFPKGDVAKASVYLRDAYLEPWTRVESRERLLHDFERVLWIAHLVRALDFAYMFKAADKITLSRWWPLILNRLERWATVSVSEIV